MSLIVSDTTPISCLLRIGRPDLLATLCPDLRIVQPTPLLGLLKEDLDAGEAAALRSASRFTQISS